MALPRFERSANPPAGLGSVLANIQIKLPGIVVPQLPPEHEPPISNASPSDEGSNLHCTKVTTKEVPTVRATEAQTSVPRRIFTESTQKSAYGFLYVPSESGERWRQLEIESRYPRLNTHLLTTRRILLCPLARFQLFETNPPRDCLVECGSPEDDATDHAAWSECVGMPHGEFWSELT